MISLIHATTHDCRLVRVRGHMHFYERVSKYTFFDLVIMLQAKSSCAPSSSALFRPVGLASLACLPQAGRVTAISHVFYRCVYSIDCFSQYDRKDGVIRITQCRPNLAERANTLSSRGRGPGSLNRGIRSSRQAIPGVRASQ